MGKVVDYDKLVTDRKKCSLCAPNLKNPSEFAQWDSDEIGPWSRWQGNLDAKLMIVGQDWGDESYFKKNEGLEGGTNPTNETLRDLIKLVGIDVGPPGDLRRNGDVFFTNAILCLKMNGMQAPTQRSWFENCKSFLRRQIEIVSPRILVCMGEHAYRSVASEFNFPADKFSTAVANIEGTGLPNGTRVFACYHCGRRTLNIDRKIEEQRKDWLRLAKFIEREVPL